MCEVSLCLIITPKYLTLLEKLSCNLFSPEDLGWLIHLLRNRASSLLLDMRPSSLDNTGSELRLVQNA